jgi:nitroimidazol reductase NimA-like FMN-containing flavoprotein (pyridoxamine 5'-phosphate oxidase superfamily)
MIIDEGLELLTEEESAKLLASERVGRVGITIGALPAIFPVNYAVIDGAIVFRTSPGSKMSAAAASTLNVVWRSWTTSDRPTTRTLHPVRSERW